MLINPRLHKGLFAVKEATMPYTQSAVHTFEPSYIRHHKQSFIGGTYQPLANGSTTDIPSHFKARHRAELYTQKAPLRAEAAHRSIYIPVTEVSPAVCDTSILALTDEQHTSSSDTEARVFHGNHALQTMPRTLQTVRTALTTAGHDLKRAGHAIAGAAHATARAARTAATTARNAWHTFTSFKAVQLIIKFFQGAHALWKKRMKFSYAFYTIVFFLLTNSAVLFLQWGTYSKPSQDSFEGLDDSAKYTLKIVQSIPGQLTRFVSQMWLEQRYIFILNLFALSLIYLVLIFIINRFWIATIIFGTLMVIYGTANKIKISLRNEPIIPADLNFLSSGNTSNLLSFIPKEDQPLISGAITFIIWFISICLFFFIFDKRRQFILVSWRKPFSCVKTILGNATRIIAIFVSCSLLYSYAFNLGTTGTWSNTWAKSMGYSPSMFDTSADAQNNGPVTTFLSMTNVKAMDRPSTYNKKTMQQLAKRYKDVAAKINKERTTSLTDSTVIMILSETFSDPTRVPGVEYSIDPIPNIRALKQDTTSGLMLSPGYGGGTANIEYQALTGLNLANFNDTLAVPYQQLVPNQKKPYSFNQIWNQEYGASGSVAIHPFYQNMYLRDTNFKKFGFSKLYTLDSKPPLKHTEKIDASPYVSDSASYQNVLDELNKKNRPRHQFIQLSTMQNHMQYNNWYENNEFKGADISTNLTDIEKFQIDTYTKGLSYTDRATADFLNALNNLSEPVTVIFYGDHLPGLYTSASTDKNNLVSLHETDYFIWSNAASSSAQKTISPQLSAYSSSNFFMALAAEHMNAKISPYLALLTQLSTHVPAMSRAVVEDSGKATYLDSNGAVITKKDLSKKTEQLLDDYKLVQYDQTSGKNYLSGEDFTKIPKFKN